MKVNGVKKITVVSSTLAAFDVGLFRQTQKHEEMSGLVVFC